MKVIAYDVREEQKELLTVTNRKKHKLTLITDKLHAGTAAFASGKRAVLLNNAEDLSPLLLQQLASFGVGYVVAGCSSPVVPDALSQEQYGIKIALINNESVNGISTSELNRFIAAETIRILDIWAAQEDDKNQLYA